LLIAKHLAKLNLSSTRGAHDSDLLATSAVLETQDHSLVEKEPNSSASKSEAGRHNRPRPLQDGGRDVPHMLLISRDSQPAFA
jgi:hypothetical protein